MKYKLYFLDTETTGGLEHDRLIQLAFKKPGDAYDEIFDELYTPEVPVTIESQAVHHIRPVMLEGKPTFADASNYNDLKKELEDPSNITVAHNAPFDVEMLMREDIDVGPAIDTLRVVRHLDTNDVFKRKNLQYLRYAMDLDDQIDVPIQAHDAKGDIIVLEKLFDRLAAQVAKLNELDLTKSEDYDAMVEKMIELSNTPVLIQKFTFGKHNGEKVADVARTDAGYLEWLLKQKLQSENLKSEEDWIHTLKFYLGK